MVCAMVLKISCGQMPNERVSRFKNQLNSKGERWTLLRWFTKVAVDWEKIDYIFAFKYEDPNKVNKKIVAFLAAKTV